MSKTINVKVGNKFIGKNHPIVIQSMTNTETSNIQETVCQILELYKAGSEIIRITVNNEKSAESVPKIKKKILQKNINIPLVGDFHYNGHYLLEKFPKCAKTLDKYRINPGNVGFGEKKDKCFSQIIKKAIEFDKPIRIGVNWGSLDKNILNDLIKKNNKLKNPISSNSILQKSLIESTIQSAKYAEKLGIKKNKIILSCKVSNVQNLISIYTKLSQFCYYPLHIGLTEAGLGTKGIIASSISIGYLLKKKIGNTIRVSLTPDTKESRTKEVKICQEILQTIELRSFSPSISSCPGCGRTTNVFFRELANYTYNYLSKKMIKWKKIYTGIENMKIAVMGCIVNGPGESKHANIGISLPGKNEELIAPVFIEGKKTHTLKGKNIKKNFINIINEYVKQKY